MWTRALVILSGAKSTEYVWLIELSDNKLSHKILASELWKIGVF